jgi:hypothetical protein
MTKNGVFFVLNRECISKPIKYFFVPERRPKGEFFSILCWLHSGWKNSLYNGCYLNRIIGLIQNLQVLWIVFISSHVPCHKFLEDVHEDSMQIPS